MAKAPYSNLFNMRDLFSNQSLSKVLPQFSDNRRSKIIDLSSIKAKVYKYLAGELQGKIRNGSLVVVGDYEQVLSKVQGLQNFIKSLVAVVSDISQHLDNKSMLYLPYVSISQIAKLTQVKQKDRLLKEILDNLQYNPNFSQGKLIQNRQQQLWQNKVGFKE